MTAAAVLQFPTTETDPLAALFAERDAIEAELARLRKVDEARQAAERDLAGLEAEQTAIDESEKSAWSAWSETCDGPAPSPRIAEREALAHKRVAAAASLASAVNGARAVEPRQLALNADFRRINDAIFAEKVARLTVEAADLHKAACDAVRVLLAGAERSDAIRDALFACRTEAMNSHNEARAAITTSAINSIESMVRPDLVGDINERARIAAEVKRDLDR